MSQGHGDFVQVYEKSKHSSRFEGSNKIHGPIIKHKIITRVANSNSREMEDTFSRAVVRLNAKPPTPTEDKLPKIETVIIASPSGKDLPFLENLDEELAGSPERQDDDEVVCQVTEYYSVTLSSVKQS